jgi:hypothetical protein
MFAIIENTLQALPSSIKLNGVTYTDLYSQPDAVLNNLGIYKLPEMPLYDAANFKLSVNYEAREWEVIALTEEEKSKNLTEQYQRAFKKLEGKYHHYLLLKKTKEEDYYVSAQLESYILGLVDYMSKVYNQEIPLGDIIDYPDCQLSSYSSQL